VKILVTGGAGFIGSNFARLILQHHPADEVRVLDKLTYAGNLDNLQDLEADYPHRYSFVQGDIANREDVARATEGVEAIVNFAAESHVDRSIMDPASAITTNVLGVYELLEAARRIEAKRFVHVSTDEVYGAVPEGSSGEDDRLRPRSPYSAGKAGGDLLVYAYHVTYGLPTMVTRGSNTFGPYQYPEKLIPIIIANALDGVKVPVYGDGRQVRDWLFVEDHCAGIDLVLRKGEPGEAYNVGGGNERYNIDVVTAILDQLERPHSLIQYVEDRPGHDLRYCVDSSRVESLGWDRSRDFGAALRATVDWYVEHQGWWRKLRGDPDYQAYYNRNYGSRGELGPNPSK
jgi:dTDP-glucose 4,6-dehydratase